MVIRHVSKNAGAATGMQYGQETRQGSSWMLSGSCGSMLSVDAPFCLTSGKSRLGLFDGKIKLIQSVKRRNIVGYNGRDSYTGVHVGTARARPDIPIEFIPQCIKSSQLPTAGNRRVQRTAQRRLYGNRCEYIMITSGLCVILSTMCALFCQLVVSFIEPRRTVVPTSASRFGPDCPQTYLANSGIYDYTLSTARTKHSSGQAKAARHALEQPEYVNHYGPPQRLETASSKISNSLESSSKCQNLAQLNDVIVFEIAQSVVGSNSAQRKFTAFRLEHSQANSNLLSWESPKLHPKYQVLRLQTSHARGRKPRERESDESSEYILDKMGNIDIFRTLLWMMKSEIDLITSQATFATTPATKLAISMAKQLEIEFYFYRDPAWITRLEIIIGASDAFAAT
ncbi:hypothetical protein WN48_04773 [Eufriesea mexicana]|uniref:Uncharacterized protein n=1 Tax=Eufriesea mexicana TaxID=516756 RepID=A0A310SJ82_9HYME|nr:hypothetical protein WN48_04773 [Eufriesea mexicana]